MSRSGSGPARNSCVPIHRTRVTSADLATSYNNRGNDLSRDRHFPDALKAHQQAVHLREKLSRSLPADVEVRRDLARSYINLGNTCGELKQLTDARTAFIKALAIQQQLIEEHPAVLEYQLDYGICLANFGHLLKDQRSYREAAARFDNAAARSACSVEALAEAAGG